VLSKLFFITRNHQQKNADNIIPDCWLVDTLELVWSQSKQHFYQRFGDAHALVLPSFGKASEGYEPNMPIILPCQYGTDQIHLPCLFFLLHPLFESTLFSDDFKLYFFLRKFTVREAPTVVLLYIIIKSKHCTKGAQGS
jgi:hypothetical protein